MAKRRHAARYEAAHDTLALRAQLGDPRQWWEYFPGQHVRTADNLLGVVTAVQDGAVQGMEQYQVRLNGGMGGGFYTASQLKPAEATTAAQAHTADLDYPELQDILVDRPDPARINVSAAKGDNPFAKDDDSDEKDDDSSDDDSDDSESDDEDDEDSSDDSDDEDDEDSKAAKGDNPFAKKDDGDDQDGGKPFSQVKAMATFSSLIAEAVADADFRFHVTAAWRDIVAKAKRIRSEGKVRVTLAEGGVIFGEVHGDHHVYETGLQRLPGRTAISSWSCGCKWAAYHWGADDDFSRFKGRMCSHALALQYEAQSRGMFGKDVTVDEHKPAWVPRDVVVRWDIDSATNQLVRSSAREQVSEAPGWPLLQTLAQALVHAGEDGEEMAATLAVVGVRVTADTNAPFGEPTSGEAYQTPHAPGATQPRMKGENPASAGFLTAGDPAGWDLALPGTLDDRLGSRLWTAEASLFEPGATATLNGMPEGALPATDGEVSNDDGATQIPSDSAALTSDVTASLRKRALAEFSPAEQRELIDEGEKEGARARNLGDRLAIEGTHYEQLEKQLQDDGSDDGGLLW